MCLWAVARLRFLHGFYKRLPIFLRPAKPLSRWLFETGRCATLHRLGWGRIFPDNPIVYLCLAIQGNNAFKTALLRCLRCCPRFRVAFDSKSFLQRYSTSILCKGRLAVTRSVHNVHSAINALRQDKDIIRMLKAWHTQSKLSLVSMHVT